METRKLRAGKGSLDVSVLGFGGGPLGNLYAPISEAESDATLVAAWDAGIRMFDTAPYYGLGLSEERFGRVLSNYPREKFVLSTKVGRTLRDCPPEEVPSVGFFDTPARSFDFDYSYEGVMRSHEASLKRMKVDYIDILLVHDIDMPTHGSRDASDARVRELFDLGGYRAAEELRTSGVVKSIGVGVNEWQVCETLLGMGDFDCFLLAGRYTLLEQEALDSFLPLCEARGVDIIIGGPFNSGILATGAVEGARYNYAPAPADIRARVARLDAVCVSYEVKLIEAALQFPLGHPAVKTIIPGANAPSQVEANIRLLDPKIPPELWVDLKSQGLIRREAPVPTR